jgi:hypothetical protein
MTVYNFSKKLKNSYKELRKEFHKELHKEALKFFKSCPKIDKIIFYWMFSSHSASMICSEIEVSKGENQKLLWSSNEKEILTQHECEECCDFYEEFLYENQYLLHAVYGNEGSRIEITKDNVVEFVTLDDDDEEE